MSSTAVPCVLLTRKRSQVQTLSRPPLFSLVKALSAPGGQRSSSAAAALRPQAAPHRTKWASGAGRHGTTTSPPTTQRGHHLSVQAHGQAAKPADLGYGRPSCEPRTANVAPSLPVRSDAGRRPRRPRTTAARRPAAPDRGAAHHTEPLQGPARPGQRGSAADTGGLSVRTPGHWTSARPVGQTSSRWDRGRGQGNDRPSQRPDILTTGDHPLGGPTLPGSRRLGALGHPGRSRHLRRVLTAATGQLPGTARHEAAPRRIALLGRFRVERRANGEASSVMARPL